jgi:hypothetical protein
MATSTDGISWTKRQPLDTTDVENFYPTLFDNGPSERGCELVVFYTASETGGFQRWQDARLMRRRLTLSW